jgi:MYXO-CTERM domain-containing protein
MPTRILLSGALAALATLAARPAAACQPPRCWPASAIPGPGARVPANVPALGFTATQIGGTFSGDPNAFELLDPMGKPVRLTVERTAPNAPSFFLRPQEALQPNSTYRIRYPQACLGSPVPEPQVVEQPLLIGPASPVPTSLGTVTVTGHRVAEASVGYFIGACNLSPLRAGLTHVQIQPSPELQAYLALGRIDVRIEGRSAPIVNYEQPGARAPVELDVYAHCAGDAGMSGGLRPGRYQVEFAADLFGVTPLPPPVTIPLDVYCDEPPAGDAGPDAVTEPPADAAGTRDGARPADAAAPVGDTGPLAEDAGVTLGAASGCGCALGGGRPAGPAAGLLLVLAALALRRRP